MPVPFFVVPCRQQNQQIRHPLFVSRPHSRCLWLLFSSQEKFGFGLSLGNSKIDFLIFACWQTAAQQVVSPYFSFPWSESDARVLAELCLQKVGEKCCHVLLRALDHHCLELLCSHIMQTVTTRRCFFSPISVCKCFQRAVLCFFAWFGLRVFCLPLWLMENLAVPERKHTQKMLTLNFSKDE